MSARGNYAGRCGRQWLRGRQARRVQNAILPWYAFFLGIDNPKVEAYVEGQFRRTEVWSLTGFTSEGDFYSPTFLKNWEHVDLSERRKSDQAELLAHLQTIRRCRSL